LKNERQEAVLKENGSEEGIVERDRTENARDVCGGGREGNHQREDQESVFITNSGQDSFTS